ncbi:fatty acyl-AMP ligase [Actinomadura harenae]|uniref:Fatty acyl-AMP ligase n=1 Tax=Actinomadura harenae TaxID=2483351 RepID=A0A3M2LM70_9ACTN|nr:fatty acyl-AMP ligase [Actinomadura harenae]RMI38562.1 fatty acyl-AMP ligase [Actinomadura harenae]
MFEHDDLIALIRARVEAGGTDVALIAHNPADPSTDTTLDYAALDREARRMAVFLGGRARPGDRVLLVHETALGFARAFLGCLYAGMIAVPAPQPDGFRRQRERLASIARDARVAVALCDPSGLDMLQEWAEEAGLGDLACLAPDDLPAPEDWTRPETGPRTIAFLQYTSGSTGGPKGVMVDHGNILANAELFGAMTGASRTMRFGGWLPMYHDFGLIGMLLIPLAHGASTVLMPPIAFVKRPHSWLHMIDRYRVNLSPAPDFAYDLCVRRIKDDQIEGLDLSRWLYAVNGSEPIKAATLRAFGERFAAHGLPPTAMLPGYGMAEATLVISGTRWTTGPVVTTVDAELLEKGEFVPAPDGRPLASSGVLEPGTIVVDPDTRRRLEDGAIGEIWIKGGHVARGYWGQEEATRRVFGWETAGGDGGYLRSEDLGTIWDGQVYVTGRIKELLIVRGRNLYPQDLEAEVRAVHPALSRGVGAVFAVPAPDEEVVVVQECRASDLGELPAEELTQLIRHAMAREFGVSLGGVVLVRPSEVQRTTSGKIQRTLTRDLFRAGELDVVHEDLSPAVRRRYRTGA